MLKMGAKNDDLGVIIEQEFCTKETVKYFDSFCKEFGYVYGKLISVACLHSGNLYDKPSKTLAKEKGWKFYLDNDGATYDINI